MGVLSCGMPYRIMMITSKKQIGAGVKGMATKAMSWNQVCKQLSGIGGFVTLDENTKVRPLELMQSLGVHVNKNSYKPKDIFTAWSARMVVDGKICMAHSVPVNVTIDGRTLRLYGKKADKYVGVSQQKLCPVVSATDKAEKTDVVVNANNILKGLQQSVFVDDTLAKIEQSATKVAAIVEGYVNIAEKKDEEQFVPVIKDEKGNWTIKTIAKVAENAKKAAKGTKGTKSTKGARKAA